MTAYGTLDQLKIRIGINKALTDPQKEYLEELLEAASRMIDTFCGRNDNGFIMDIAASDEYFTAYGEAYLRISPCMEITTVAVKASRTATTYTAWTSPTTPLAGDGDWIPCCGTPEDPVYSKTPYTMLRVDPNGNHALFLDGDGDPVVKVTAKWGKSGTCPSPIREATLMQAAVWYKQFGVSGSTTTGTAEFAELRYRRSLSMTVKDMLIEGSWVTPLYGGR